MTESDQRKTHATEVVERISDFIASEVRCSEKHDISLGRGVAGWALLLSQANTFGLGNYEQETELAIHLCMNRFESLAPNIRLMSGLTGVAWALRFVLDAGPTLSEDLDSVLEEYLTDENNHLGPGFFDGLSGLAFYVSSHPAESVRERLGDAIVRQLEQSANVVAPGQSSWLSEQATLPADRRREYSEGAYEIGSAHGVAGILLTLNRLQVSQSIMLLKERLLREGSEWLAAQIGVHDVSTELPPLVDPTGRAAPFASRQAWCSGAGMAGLALLQVGQSLSNQRFSDLGTSLLLATTEPSSRPATNPYLCHGTMGNALLFQHLHQTMNRNEFRNSLLAIEIPTVRELGPLPEQPLGLIEGLSGVGLALLTLLGGEKSWTKILLLDGGNHSI